MFTVHKTSNLDSEPIEKFEKYLHVLINITQQLKPSFNADSELYCATNQLAFFVKTIKHDLFVRLKPVGRCSEVL